MNKMVAYAKAVTIRDRQLNEKKDIWDDYKTQEKKKDLMMEVERLKKIKYYEEEEERKKQEVIRGHQVIIEQIKQREIDRLKQKEEQEREAQQLLRAAEQLKKEEEIKNEVNSSSISEKEAGSVEDQPRERGVQQECYPYQRTAPDEIARGGRKNCSVQ